jgi:hypothetical protein
MAESRKEQFGPWKTMFQRNLLGRSMFSGATGSRESDKCSIHLEKRGVSLYS